MPKGCPLRKEKEEKKKTPFFDTVDIIKEQLMIELLSCDPYSECVFAETSEIRRPFQVEAIFCYNFGLMVSFFLLCFGFPTPFSKV